METYHYVLLFTCVIINGNVTLVWMEFSEMPVENLPFFERSFVPALIARVSLQWQTLIAPDSVVLNMSTSEWASQKHFCVSIANLVNHLAWINNKWLYCLFLIFFKNFWWTHVLSWSNWYPCFGPLLVTSPLGFKVRLASLIYTWQRHTWCMFP